MNSKYWIFCIKDFENILYILNEALKEKNKHKQNDININLAKFA